MLTPLSSVDLRILTTPFSAKHWIRTSFSSSPLHVPHNIYRTIESCPFCDTRSFAWRCFVRTHSGDLSTYYFTPMNETPPGIGSKTNPQLSRPSFRAKKQLVTGLHGKKMELSVGQLPRTSVRGLCSAYLLRRSHRQEMHFYYSMVALYQLAGSGHPLPLRAYPAQQ